MRCILIPKACRFSRAGRSLRFHRIPVILIFMLTRQVFEPLPNSDGPQCDCPEHEEDQQLWCDRNARSSTVRYGSADCKEHWSGYGCISHRGASVERIIGATSPRV